MDKTIEQKARAYDKAFERAKRMFSEKELNYIFSELTESEDEKIKKRIIQAIKIREKEMNEEWSDEIAWIEKQGNNLVENGYTNNKDVIEYAGNYSRTIWRKLMDNFKNIKDYHIGCNDVSDIVLNAIINTYNWLEKPINKPKFHEGDFIKHNKANVIYKIISVNSGSYYIENIDTNGRIELFHVEQNFHLWSIDDAKDGDILYSPKHNLLWIYKNKGKYHAAINLNYANPISFDSNIVIPSDVCPAIKEQCNFLLQKMSEAGYIVDFKKKKLRKLKFKVGDEVITENEESLTITRIDEEGYWSNDLFICGFDDSDEWELVEQKYHMIDEDKAEIDYCFTKMMNGEKVSSTWSEEDEKRLDRICKTLWKNRKGDTDEIYQQEQDINWLKSLKPQPKQQWSEEDKERYISCLQRLGTGNPDQPETINSKWFKEHVTSLPQWKPNKKQMHFLNWLANVKLGDSVVEQEVSKNLNELYNDLTKL